MSKGGAETQLVKLALHLQSNFNKVLIISLKPINQFNGDLKKMGLNVIFLRKWSTHFMFNIKQLFKTIKLYKPDVVIAFMFIAIIFARLFKLVFKFKLISTIRNSVIHKKWYLPFKMTSYIDDAVVFNSFASKNNFEARNLVRKHGIVINNGISIPSLSNKKKSDTNDSCFTWVCIAHFSYNKDYQTLFKAIELIKDRNFMVNIIGELNNESWPFKLVKDLNIESRINILGFKKDINTYLEHADAFVLSSHSEGMPNAILEAMAHAKPIVVTGIDGNNELLQNGNCGFLCKRKDHYDMASNMIKVMELSDKERATIGLNGRKYIESNFKEEMVMNSWSNLVKHVAE